MLEYTLVELIVLTPPADEPAELIKVITYDVGSLSLEMLRVTRSTNGRIQLLTSIAGCNDNGTAPTVPQIIKHVCNKAVNTLYSLGGWGVVDPQPVGRI